MLLAVRTLSYEIEDVSFLVLSDGAFGDILEGFLHLVAELVVVSEGAQGIDMDLVETELCEEGPGSFARPAGLLCMVVNDGVKDE